MGLAETDGVRLGLSMLEVLTVMECEGVGLSADTLGKPDWEGELEYDSETLLEGEPLGEPVTLCDPMVALALADTVRLCVTDTE